MPTRRRARGAAFTLVELLVGMTVSIVLVVILAQIFSMASAAWRRGENQIDAYREARAALQLMARDLSMTSAPFAKGALVSPAPSASPSPSPSSGGAASAALAGSRAPVLVLAPYPNSDSKDTINEQAYCLTALSYGSSALCAVGYYCQWIPTRDASNPGASQSGAPRAYALMRQFLDSDKTFARIKQARGGAGTDNPLAFLDLYSRDGSPSPAPTELAAYIWDLQFRTETTLKETSPATAQPAPVVRGRMDRVYGAAPPYPEQLPQFVEIRFKALSAAAARQLEGNGGITQETWANPPAPGSAPPGGSPWKYILPGLQQFVARVPLRGNGPVVTPTP